MTTAGFPIGTDVIPVDYDGDVAFGRIGQVGRVFDHQHGRVGVRFITRHDTHLRWYLPAQLVLAADGSPDDADAELDDAEADIVHGMWEDERLALQSRLAEQYGDQRRDERGGAW